MKTAAFIALAVLAAPGWAQNLNTAQQLALNSLPPALTAAVTSARDALNAATFAVPFDRAVVTRRAAAVAEAEQALAMARADLIARLQASPNRLNAAQLDRASQQAAGRGGRGGGAGPVVTFANAPKTLLWPNGAPGATGDTDADKPTLGIYLAPKRADGKPVPAVVIAPGGAYRGVAVDVEGTGTAEWLNSLGVSAFVLRYRLAPYRYPIETDDGQRAMRVVRARAAEFGIDPNKIGLMGFSAGGHLAAYTSSVFDSGKPDATDPIERASSRPDFAILIYPVITLDPAVAGPQNLGAYAGSGRNLLGDNPAPGLIEKVSADTRVTSANPPTFLYHGAADTTVAVENSTRFFLALRKAGVPAELHTFESGMHGTAISLGDPLQGSLSDFIKRWLRVRGVVSFEVP